MASLDTSSSLLDLFENIARSEVDLDAVECGKERWTYGELDVISTGIALEMHKSYGQKPMVAIVSENHPFTLATILATWKLGGIVAPLDYNVPRDIMERMLLDIKPTFVLVPSNQVHVQKVVAESSSVCVPFDAKSTTITALMQKYLDHSAPLPREEFPPPNLEDIALYIHTSSASSVNNVKCVPLSHKSILAGSRARLAWWKRTWPQQNFDHLRVLGWSPWSHIIGISHDIVAATFLTRGTYVFAMIPSAYGEAGKASRFLDVSGQVLETAIEKKPTAFSGVPWVLEGFMRTFSQEKDFEKKNKIKDAIQHFKVFGSGGAATSAECVEFATELGIPLVFDIGMTEIGSPIFHSTIDGSKGWNAGDCLVSDASINIINEDGSPATDEGELVITSRLTSKGYLNYDNSSFTIENGDLVTFRTGDIYGYIDADRLIWKGRKEDYIQMSSGESLDPRVIEVILNQCPSVARSCVVGNNFLRTSSQVVCAIIEPVRDENSSFSGSRLAEIIRTIAIANRGLAPPLRISWSRVLLLNVGQQIPLTGKGAVFRKKLEGIFGEQLGKLLNRSDDPHISVKATTPASVQASTVGTRISGKTKDQIASIVANIVVDALGITTGTLENNPDATFAELGMDSSMSTKIVNRLNQQLEMHLPLNTCHTYIDLASLTNAIFAEHGIEGSASSETRSSRRPSPEEREEVVIVGQSIRLPGDIQDPRSFWEALIEQRDDIMTPVPPSRWDHASFFRAPNSKAPASPCDISLDKAGWIDLTSFDHSFFGLGLSEAFFVAPTIRLTLEMAFEALENANIPLSKIKGSDMGVFVANAMDDGYIQLLFADKGWGAYSRYWATGTAASTACGRLSYLLDIHGPSITVDTACSSGLIALHEAVKYLQSGEGESAIVCGANVHPWPGTLGFLTAQKMTSPKGRCATFTNEADGYVPSEGAAGVVLKTKRAAFRDGDKIIGVVRSTITKHDGRSQGLVAPNVKAQIGMQIELLEKAGLSPSEIDFLEAHGTGTSLGDLIEIQGINEVFKSSHTPDAPLVVGASKACVGHTELIAGLIGVLKTLGTFKDGEVPGLVQLTENNMNPALDCSVVPLHIPHENVTLKQSSNRPLRALVLSNGFAGSIAGAILEAPSNDMRVEATPRIPENTPLMFVVSAKSPDALIDYLNKYIDFCLDASPSLFPSICYTSCVGREHYRYRFACVAHNIQDLIARIEERIQNPPSASGPTARRILFGFPGQGCQYQGMGRYLANQYSGFCKIITDAATKATNLTGYQVLPYLVEDSALPGSISIDNSEVAQVCIYTFQYAMASWLETLGIQAHSVMGHSLGEITAAVVSRAFSFEIGLQFVVTRARVLRSDPACPGGMAAIAATEDVVARYIVEMGLQQQLSIAVYNAADNNVVSGDLKAIEKLMAAVKRDGMRATKLTVAQGFHSHSIAPGLPALGQWLEQHESVMKGLEKNFFSTVLAKEISKHQRLDTQYWVDHAQNAVRFLQTAQLANKSANIDVIVDIGPQPTVWSNMQTPEFSAKTRLAFTGKRGKDQIVAMLTALSGLFEKGINIDFDALNNQMPYKLTMTDIPTYPFQRVHNYPAFIANRHHLLGFGTAIQAPKTSNPQLVIDQALYDFLDLHRIEGRRVLPGAAMVDLFARATDTKALKSFRFHVALVLGTPEMEVRAEIDEKGVCQLVLQDDSKTKFCSGNVGEKSSLFTPRQSNPHCTPIRVMSKAEIYECFKNVQFGDLFRTVQEVKFWETHADGDVKVERTSNLSHDRIRKIDACLHMFGALSSRLAPPMDDDQGAYLPTSLEDFTFHSDDIPYNFTCRYYLPLEIGRGARTLSASFEVLADTGELLLSCKKYSVAWVPRGVVHRQQEVIPSVETKSWYRNVWIPQPLSSSEVEVPMFQDTLYLGSTAKSRIIPALSTSAKNMTSLCLSDISDQSKITSVLSAMQARNALLVVDLSEANHFPDSNQFNTISVQILSFLKALLKNKFRPSCFLAITSSSAPFDLHKEDLTLVSGYKASARSLVGSIVHGMLRVFRTECHTAAWCLDLTDLDTLGQDRIGEIILNEIHARLNGLSSDAIVSYRKDASKETICRLVPVLHPIEIVSTTPPSGTAVIMGLGSIGIKVAAALAEAGVRQIVFLGQRPEANAEVQKEIGSLSMGIASSYRQVDVCDIQSLTLTLADINETQGGIKNIIHISSPANGELMASVDIPTYEQVLRPKVLGSWNLHLACQALGLALDSFVLLSCVSVIPGKPGQVANITANAFMDSLATYRHNCGLPGISLQLGANDLSEGDIDNDISKFMEDSEWSALILKAMSVPIARQIVAESDVNTILTTPSLAQDPIFTYILSSTVPSPTKKSKLSPEEANKLIVNLLRVAMELLASERLDTNEPLTSCGADSITFAQFKGQVMKELDVDVPVMYLSDDYTINDMILNIVETYMAA